MSKRLAFITIIQIREYAQKHFPADTAFSRMNTMQRAYANVYQMTRLDPPSLTQMKQSLQASCTHARFATQENVYQFFIDRIHLEDSTTLTTVTQELSRILEKLQAMEPLVASDNEMDDAAHEQWMSQHTEIELLGGEARNIVLRLVPKEIKAILKQIDEQATALYPKADVGDAELSLEENALYNRAKASEL